MIEIKKTLEVEVTLGPTNDVPLADIQEALESFSPGSVVTVRMFSPGPQSENGTCRLNFRGSAD